MNNRERVLVDYLDRVLEIQRNGEPSSDWDEWKRAHHEMLEITEAPMSKEPTIYESDMAAAMEIAHRLNPRKMPWIAMVIAKHMGPNREHGQLLGEAAEVMELARIAMDSVLGEGVDVGDYDTFCEEKLPRIYDSLLQCGKKLVDHIFPGSDYPGEDDSQDHQHG